MLPKNIAQNNISAQIGNAFHGLEESAVIPKKVLPKLYPTNLSGKIVWPIIEGGKGIGASNGKSAGAFAAAGAIGTISGVNADSYDKDGNPIPYIYTGKTRKERQLELISQSIKGGITQAQIAHDVSGGMGRIHMNVLWEMGGTQKVLEGILSNTKGLIHGITCGAGMPYKLAEFAARYQIYYYPIVSSMRAFRALWKRSYSKISDWLGGVVYEDPWRAGGHNGLSNSENPLEPENPYPRVAAIRSYMNEVGLRDTPIVMAGGVWHLNDWQDWLDNPEIGNIAFQLGTRPLLTQESPISNSWKNKLLNIAKGDVSLNKFSPTGFYSSAVHNDFLQELYERSERQILVSKEQSEHFSATLPIKVKGRQLYIESSQLDKVNQWLNNGFTTPLITPDDTIIFVSPDRASIILQDQRDCMGCLSACGFSNWAENEKGTTGRKADPRSYCIQKTLQKIIHSEDCEDNLMFAGHNVYKFANDPFYANGHIPTVRELIERILQGD